MKYGNPPTRPRLPPAPEAEGGTALGNKPGHHWETGRSVRAEWDRIAQTAGPVPRLFISFTRRTAAEKKGPVGGKNRTDRYESIYELEF